MKRMRKGFTLVELLIVITIIGLLSTMMMISGTDAQNSAKVTKIMEGFRSLSVAMMMYADAKPTEAAAATEATMVTGAAEYIKNDTLFAATAKAGVYAPVQAGSTWWLVYILPDKTGAINDILGDKAKDYGLKKAADADPKKANNDYDGKDKEVYVAVF